MKRLGIITGSFPPTNIVGALRPFRLAKHFGRCGWKVVVLTHPPKAGEGLDVRLLEELDHSCEIKYVSQTPSGGSGKSYLRKRIGGIARDILKSWIRPDLDVVYVPSYLGTFRKIQEKEPVDVVLTTSPPHSIHLSGLLIKKRFKLPWVVDFRDPWDDFVRTGVGKIHNPIERYLEREVISQSDAIISTTDMYTNLLSRRHVKVSQSKFRTVTNSYDISKCSKKKRKSQDKFIICYTGIFYPSKDPYGFFRALRKWFDYLGQDEKSRYQDRLEVHLVGSGDQITRRIIHDLRLENNVIFFHRVSHEAAIEKTLQADLALISTGIGEKTRPGWLPSKFFEYLGCRIPVLALIREGELADMIRGTKSGHVLTQEDHVQIAKIIRDYIDRKLYGMGTSANNYCSFSGAEFFEEEYVMKKFASIIEGIA